jgi:hypothetical protein
VKLVQKKLEKAVKPVNRTPKWQALMTRRWPEPGHRILIYLLLDCEIRAERKKLEKAVEPVNQTIKILVQRKVKEVSTAI